ncbi:hypothetical protein K438DRAFT_2032918 [Mycena galopus ATCC 62051]|nr:hypothetical protein K438DRAFT_2032918 [Mycena galopus ATCC 62051]
MVQILRHPLTGMATRASYLHQTPGPKHTPTYRDLLCNPVRCTAILLVVALSLTSIAVLTIEPPWGVTITPSLLSPEYESDLLDSLDEMAIQMEEDESEQDDESGQEDEPGPVAVLIDDTVYHAFVAPSPEQALVDQRVRPIRAHAALSVECRDNWVSTGLWQDPCTPSMVEDAEVDLVWVWVNGSDPLHQKSREALLTSTKYKTKEARWREHDELRYSLRAARDATASWPNSTWHIVSADVPHPDAQSSPSFFDTDGRDDTEVDDEANSLDRLGLIPQWLDIECAFYGCPDPEPQPPIRLHHDTQIFRLTGRPGVGLKAENAAEWLGKVVPSFNSHAVESQLAQLDPDIVSDNIVALNDDQFIILPLPPSAFHTTLYGPVFRVDTSLLVGPDSSGNADGGGEWRSLGWTQHLLNQRFGTRKRPYMRHNARALSLPLMHELSLAFGEYFAATPLSQFRGSHQVAEEFEVNTIFMATHYVIERHREALLWAWVVGKWARSGGRVLGGEGMLGREEKRLMWAELGGEADEDSVVLKQATRGTKAELEVNMAMAGVQPPKSTTYSWVSMDGYSPNFRMIPTKIDLKRQCIGEDAERAWNLFRRLAKEDLACGDNIITALIHNSRSGLEAFLPTPSAHATKSSLDDPLILPLEITAAAPPLPSNPRAFAVQLLMRYAHVLGDSPMFFMSMTSAAQTQRQLAAADRQKQASLMGINDDLPEDSSQAEGDAVLKKWFAKRWPKKLACEI